MPGGERGSVVACVVFFLVGALSPATASATTYAVGPGRPYPDLQAVARLLRPGDRVEVDGGVTYPGGVVLREAGTARAKITIVGLRAGGRRPVIAGGSTTLELRGDHYVVEGLDITGGTSRCLFHHADDIVVRDTVVHDCPHHGVLGADEGAGSLTLAYVEVYRAGEGDHAHPIYMATDEEEHPRSVFRMEHCYVHDATGGNSVKSRAERNEIYANWIEGGRYHELELIGPDGDERKRRREDSDVVGNVLYKTRPGYAIRVGGDGSGDSNGRFRFVNNTILLGPGPGGGAFRLFSGLESIEMHNNAIARAGGGAVRVVVEQEVRWAAGRPVVTGTNNWIPAGSSGVPPEWIHTLTGADPRFVSARDSAPGGGEPAHRRGRGGSGLAAALRVPCPARRASRDAPAGRAGAGGHGSLAARRPGRHRRLRVRETARRAALGPRARPPAVGEGARRLRVRDRRVDGRACAAVPRRDRGGAPRPAPVAQSLRALIASRRPHPPTPLSLAVPSSCLGGDGVGRGGLGGDAASVSPLS